MTDPPALSDSVESAPTFEPPGLGRDIVFLVDDDRDLLRSLERFLEREGVTVAAFSNPLAALDAMSDWVPTVLVTDQEMPEMTGMELGRRALEKEPDLRIIVATGAGSEALAQESLRLGAVEYLTKPFEPRDLTDAIQESLLRHARDQYSRSMRRWLRRTVEERTRSIREVSLAAMGAVVDSLEARHPGFVGHSLRVAACAARIARTLDLDVAEVEAIHAAGRLHDIGMSGIPDSLVEKAGPLDPRETALLRTHSRAGSEILEPMAHLGPAITYVLEHHERLDGSGYPDGLAGGDVSIGGQIVGLAEAFTALTEDRAFRPARTEKDAVSTLDGSAGTLFAPRLLAALKAGLES